MEYIWNMASIAWRPRGMVRLERKAADSKGPDVPPEGPAREVLRGETHGKPMEKPWENGGLTWFYGI